MKIKYIGQKPRHSDRLYGTKQRWHGHGDICVIEDESAVAAMLKNHPEVYELVDETDPGAFVAPVAPVQPSPPPTSVSHVPAEQIAKGVISAPKVDVEDPVADGGTDDCKPEEPELTISVTEPASGGVIQLPISDCSKAQLSAYAQEHFGEAFDQRKTQATLAETLAGLIEERGHPEAPVEPA